MSRERELSTIPEMTAEQSLLMYYGRLAGLELMVHVKGRYVGMVKCSAHEGDIEELAKDVIDLIAAAPSGTGLWHDYETLYEKIMDQIRYRWMYLYDKDSEAEIFLGPGDWLNGF